MLASTPQSRARFERAAARRCRAVQQRAGRLQAVASEIASPEREAHTRPKTQFVPERFVLSSMTACAASARQCRVVAAVPRAR